MGLNFTLLMLSKPQVREHLGLVLCSSQMSTWWPQVAKTGSFQWWSIPVYTVFKRKEQKKKKTKQKFKNPIACINTQVCSVRGEKKPKKQQIISYEVPHDFSHLYYWKITHQCNQKLSLIGYNLPAGKLSFPFKVHVSICC